MYIIGYVYVIKSTKHYIIVLYIFLKYNNQINQVCLTKIQFEIDTNSDQYSVLWHARTFEI